MMLYSDFIDEMLMHCRLAAMMHNVNQIILNVTFYFKYLKFYFNRIKRNSQKYKLYFSSMKKKSFNSENTTNI